MLLKYRAMQPVVSLFLMIKIVYSHNNWIKIAVVEDGIALGRYQVS